MASDVGTEVRDVFQKYFFSKFGLWKEFDDSDFNIGSDNRDRIIGTAICFSEFMDKKELFMEQYTQYIGKTFRE